MSQKVWSGNDIFGIEWKSKCQAHTEAQLRLGYQEEGVSQTDLCSDLHTGGLINFDIIYIVRDLETDTKILVRIPDMTG